MSWSFFVALVLVGSWILLPLGMVVALTQFDDELMDDSHH